MQPAVEKFHKKVSSDDYYQLFDSEPANKPVNVTSGSILNLENAVNASGREANTIHFYAEHNIRA